MSWDPNAGNGYDNYGNYGYEQNNQQQQPPQGHAGERGYDMGGGFGDYGQQQQPQVPQQPQQPPQQQQQPQQQGYYNPGDYGQQQQQQHAPQQPVQSGGYQPQNAYKSTPTPQGVAPPQQQQQPSAFSLPGMGDTGVNPMVANMAMEYGQNFAAKGGEELKKNLDKYVSIGQLKYYFAVDNTYVGKKLALLLFPFTRSDWSVRYSQDEPVQPKFDVNAPDLYIPCMAYVTYVLIVGYILGLRDAFSPDLLASTASSCLVWLVLELGVIYLSLTLMNIATNLCKWDILSFSTYKYVAMIAVLLSGLVLQSKTAYYAILLYVSGALAFFLVRTLKLRIEPEVHGMQVHGKRKLYMILFYSGLQPIFIWWMTSYLVPISSSIAMPGGLGGGFPGAAQDLDDAAPLGMMDEP